ncbi:type II toxin-antitoxin system HipA family toxin [Mitsuaria sp. GD03876]|uniref:type II toxin-antitoxin system HipA family toxin n=1 Tax=Mitsuaria sp. GD03876 TaxID=2975399 RepID=UPI00244A08D8|nr:type II toxin-antitoxin system HipA family toxin [Mitsuaria sp. GD03876]MDH0863407.1 type II toxin-antitoxin system HipA family toxin [Mitsuaria sp. GD03876]
MAALHLWMNGQPVGTWEVQSRTGIASLRYERSWQDSPQGRALSLSLPFDADLGSEIVTNYFENLLPDSRHIRRRIRERFHTGSDEAFDLLKAIGRDCVGALQILPPDESPEGWNRISGDPLTESEVGRILAGVTSPIALGHGDENDFRVSIAGAQEKTALLRIDGQWHRPRGATPTTHILKLPLGLVGNVRADMTESVENEWLCAQILRAFGLPVATTEMGVFGGAKALVVERFDRLWQQAAQPWILRLPQEDFCQAMGLPPDLKYQSDGGPTMLGCLQQLRISERLDDAATFAIAQFAFWLLAATDGHAKNFSIQHLRAGKFAMTPLYDVLSVWPVIGRGANQIEYHRAKLAMGLKSKNMHYRLSELQPRHWHALAAQAGGDAWPRMLDLAHRVPEALDAVERRLPAGFPESTWQPIASGTRRHARQFLDDAPGLRRASTAA